MGNSPQLSGLINAFCQSVKVIEVDKTISNQLFGLINAVNQSVKVIGIDKTISNVNAGLRKENMVEYPLYQTFQKVLLEVAGAFGISGDEILHGKGRKNERYYAVGFCAYYLHWIYKFDMEAVAILLEKEISICYKSSYAIKNLNQNHPADDRYKKTKLSLDSIFKL